MFTVEPLDVKAFEFKAESCGWSWDFWFIEGHTSST